MILQVVVQCGAAHYCNLEIWRKVIPRFKILETPLHAERFGLSVTLSHI